MAPGNIADRHAGLHRLGDHGQLQINGEPTPMGDAGHNFDLRERVGHRRMPRLIPRPSGYCRCPVETGCSSGPPCGLMAGRLSTSAKDSACTGASDGTMARVEVITGVERRRR
jgi:hypothetical protein